MHRQAGFTLIELLVAMTVALVLASMMFQLFHQNERVLRDQTLVMEMQQTARIVAAQIADEVRMAGQGVPTYAARFDSAPSEAVAVFLGSSDSSRIDFRAGLSNIEVSSTVGSGIDFTLGASKTVGVATTTGFSTGKSVYVFGPTTNAAWIWLRADIASTNSSTLAVIPRNTGGASTFVHFDAQPTVVLEEAVSIYLSSGSVRHATASGFANPANPTWSAANELGKNVKALVFTYYDALGNVVQPTSLSNRLMIVRVKMLITVEAASALSNGTRPSYSLEVQTIPRNIRLSPGPM